MEYVTQLIGKVVLDQSGERFGRLAEIVVTPADPLPLVAAYQVKTEDGAFSFPGTPWMPATTPASSRSTGPSARFRRTRSRSRTFRWCATCWTSRSWTCMTSAWCASTTSASRRWPPGGWRCWAPTPAWPGCCGGWGWKAAVDRLGRLLHFAPPHGSFIPWNDVESLPTHNAGDPIKLKISHEKLSKLHPADIGEILNQMDPAHRKEVLDSLDLETAAGALAEADDDVQVAALQHMDEERAADILEEMGADEAADVLGDMDRLHRDDLLGRMDAEDREEVEELLEYHDETAGGLMTNEYVAIRRDLTAQQTIDRLRELEPEAETIYYVYVVDEEEHLVGVISLRDLIIARPECPIETFMKTQVKSLHVNASADDVARRFERYKLLALPVVDDENCLQGIVTIDDTLEQLLPPTGAAAPAAPPTKPAPEPPPPSPEVPRQRACTGACTGLMPAGSGGALPAPRPRSTAKPGQSPHGRTANGRWAAPTWRRHSSKPCHAWRPSRRRPGRRRGLGRPERKTARPSQKAHPSR